MLLQGHIRFEPQPRPQTGGQADSSPQRHSTPNFTWVRPAPRSTGPPASSQWPPKKRGTLHYEWFFTDGVPVLTGDRSRPEMSADLAAALLDAQVLIVDVFARAEPFPNAGAVYSDEGFRWEGESEWRQTPHVFPLRWVFDLAGAERREILLDVLERCG